MIYTNEQTNERTNDRSKESKNERKQLDSESSQLSGWLSFENNNTRKEKVHSTTFSQIRYFHYYRENKQKTFLYNQQSVIRQLMPKVKTMTTY